MPNSKAIIIIPARLNSTRLPGKPLADIAGKPMISRVYEQAIKSKSADVVVACAESSIASVIDNLGGKAILTDPNHLSGTDRIAQALSIIDPDKIYQIIVNLQGDLPLVSTDLIQQAVNSLTAKNDYDIITFAAPINNDQEINNPNIVKIVIANSDHQIKRAIYFSRSAIPYNADIYYHHIGIYSYRRVALEKFINYSVTNLERQESLEQLRAIEHGLKIGVIIVDQAPLGVDTKDDLIIVRNKFLRSDA